MKKSMRNLVVLIIVFVLMSYSSISLANEVSDLKDEQKEIKDAINKAEEKIDEIEGKKTEAQKQVGNISTQISGYQDEIDELTGKIKELNNSITEAEKQIKQDEEEYAKQQQALDDRLVAMYKTGETSYLDFMLSSSSLTDFISSYYLISQVAEYDTKMLEQLEEHRQKIENEKNKLETDKKDVETSKKMVEAKQGALRVAMKEKEKYVDQLDDESKKLEKELAQLEKENREMEAKIKAAEERYKAQLEALRNSSAGSVPTGSGYFIRPVSGGYVSCYGYYSSGRFHGAIDYAISSGSTVMAAADGVVILTENLTYSYGTYVVIEHANGMRTYYAHGTRGSICVSPGQTVKQGQKIMLSGNTGNSSGPHLHFEVRKPVYSNGKATYPYYSYATGYGKDSRVNPALYM